MSCEDIREQSECSARNYGPDQCWWTRLITTEGQCISIPDCVAQSMNGTICPDRCEDNTNAFECLECPNNDGCYWSDTKGCSACPDLPDVNVPCFYFKDEESCISCGNCPWDSANNRCGSDGAENNRQFIRRQIDLVELFPAGEPGSAASSLES